MSRDTKLTIKVNDLEKKQIEALADIYDCSQAAAGRMLFSNHYQSLFGDIHPEALERHDIDVDAIIQGEIGPEEIDDDLKMDGDGPAKVPATDGGVGAAVSPSNHSPVQTPQDLATAGPALSWDDLTDAIDKHWGDDLEIHPDRVEPERLKNNHDMCSKIIAGILRYEQDVIAGPLIEQRIEDYLGHKVTRADYEAGLKYRIEQYKPQIIEHLEEHPNITVETYYASEQTLEEQLPDYTEDLIDELHSNDAPDLEAWLDERCLESHQMHFDDYDDWLEALKEYRMTIAKLSGVLVNGQFGEVLKEKLDYPEEHFKDAPAYLVSVLRGAKETYANVPEHARFVVITEYADLDVEYHLDIDMTETASMDFKQGEDGNGQMPLEERFSIIAENL